MTGGWTDAIVEVLGTGMQLAYVACAVVLVVRGWRGLLARRRDELARWRDAGRPARPAADAPPRRSS